MKANLEINQTETLGKDEKSPRVSSLILNELWEEILYKEETCWGRVISDSMHPVIVRGNQVLVEITTINKVGFGDIIVFKKNGLLVTHRMLGKHRHKGEYYIQEKGDATLRTSLIPAKDIVGRVSRIRMADGKIRTLYGTGRPPQLILSCISGFSFYGWNILEYCLTGGRKYQLNYRFREWYSRFFTVLRKITVAVF